MTTAYYIISAALLFLRKRYNICLYTHNNSSTTLFVLGLELTVGAGSENHEATITKIICEVDTQSVNYMFFGCKGGVAGVCHYCIWRYSHQIRNVELMLVQCWACVVDSRVALYQLWIIPTLFPRLLSMSDSRNALCISAVSNVSLNTLLCKA